MPAQDTRAFQVKPSGAITTFPWSSNPQFSRGNRGFRLDIDLTAIAGATPGVAFTIRHFDQSTQAYADLLGTASITAAGHFVLHVGPDFAAAANAAANTVAPKQWQIRATQSAGTLTGATFSLGVTYYG